MARNSMQQFYEHNITKHVLIVIRTADKIYCTYILVVVCQMFNIILCNCGLVCEKGPFQLHMFGNA